MRGIFISYRREDAEGQAGRLFDDLSAHYGADAVFMDVAGIRKGLDFRRIIQEHVTSCGVLLVIIGKSWLSAADGSGKRRLDDPNDFVRLETAAALSRDIPVVPVLVHGASMPKEHELPPALRDLAFRNGTELTHARWDSDVKALIDDLRPYLAAGGGDPLDLPDSATPASPTPLPSHPRSSSHPGRWIAIGGLALAGAVALLVLPQPRADHTATIAATSASAAKATGVDTPRAPEPAAPPAVTVAQPPKPDEADKAVAQAAEAEATRIAAAKAARAAAARKQADEQRRRDEAVLIAQRAEEQRKRDDDARRAAQEQAEKERQAAEQAAAARVFTDFATAIIGSRQGQRR